MKTPDRVLIEWTSDEIAFDLGQGPRVLTRGEITQVSESIWNGQINVYRWDYYGPYFSNQWAPQMIRSCMGQRATGPWLAQFESAIQAALYALFEDTGTSCVAPLVRTLMELEASGEL